MAKVFCFGNTSNGELGLGGIEDEHILRPRKQKLAIDLKKYKLRQLCSGRNHTLVLLQTQDQNSVVLSCGSNERSQIGRTGSWKKLEPIEVLDNHVVTYVCCGANHSLVLTEANQIFSWGCNLFGQLGIGNKVDESVEKPSLVKKLAAEHVVQIACGGNHSLALTKSGLIYSWGSNAFGQLGNGTKGNCVNTPIEMVSLRSVPIRLLASGGSHSAVLSYTQAIYVWGKNEFGQLGLNDTIDRAVPTIQSTLRSQKICYIDCGDEHTVALTCDGGLFTWGAGMYGQLGHSRNVNEILPRRVFELMGNVVTQVSCGRCHTLASVGSQGRVYAFGLNGSGQLGIGTQMSKFVPTNVTGKWSEVGIRDLSVRNIAGSLLPVINESQLDSPKRSPSTPRNVKSPVKDIYITGDEPDCDISFDDVSDDCDNDSEMNSDEDIIVEEPEDYAKNESFKESNFVCTHDMIIKPDLIEIVEYVSDTDSDSETRTNREHLVLKEVIASKGDQSFVIVVPLNDNSNPIDFRFDTRFEQIYKLENETFETLKTFTSDDTIPIDYIDYIENVFSSVSCLNASYIYYDNKNFTALPAVDWDSVIHGFSCIEEFGNTRLKELISKSLQKVITGLPNIHDQLLHDYEVLRIYFLLPLFHEFRSGVESAETMNKLIGRYSRAVISLSDYSMEALEKWWSQLDERYFRDFMYIYKKCVQRILDIQAKQNEENNENVTIDAQLDEHLPLFLSLMSILNKVNQKSCKLSYKEFYIEGISDKFDLKRDYIYWLSSKANDRNKNQAVKNFFLTDYSFIFDPPAKTSILATDSLIRQQNAAESAIYRSLVPFPFSQTIFVANPYLVISVNRNSILHETINCLCFQNQNPSDFKKPLKVNFEGEEAIDAGQGMKKEFFLLLLKDMLDQKFGMFNEYKETNTIWFNPIEDSDKEDLIMYHLIGIVCGLAIYNQVIIYLHFPLVLYKKLLNERLDLEDLNSLDPILVKNLKEILDTTYGEEEFNAIYSDLTFTITLTCFGSPVEYELEKGGKNKILNYNNREEYVKLYWNYILNESVEKQFDSFKNGFIKVLEPEILHLFHAEELMQLVTGQEVYDWHLLEKSSTEYKPPFSASHPTIAMFWNVFHSLNNEQKKSFLLFLTGSDRIPILGMKALKIMIQPMKVSDSHLPVAHTCFNVLDLPQEYASEDKLRAKLVQAIEHTHGFALA